MTCIVGAVIDGVVALGGDSMAQAGCAYDLRENPKVVRVGDLLIGASGYPRVIDVLAYWFEPPAIDDDPVERDPMRYMVREFVPAVRQLFEAQGIPLKPDDGHEWAMLVAAGGRLFAVYDDWQVEETQNSYHAVGCGHRVAIGALHALSAIKHQATAERLVELALQAAEASDSHVRSPFVIETVAV